MRILASNPDTIGDMVLRQPLYRALREAGHELLLVVREGVRPLVPYVAPGAETLVLPGEPYRDDIAQHWDDYRELFDAAREFRPDVLLVAPYRWTQFDEKLADELKDVPGLRRVGMSGRLYPGDPYLGHPPESRLTFDVTAEVPREMHEAEKNAALAAAVLGAPPAEVDPRLEADEASLARAREVLSRLGLEPGGYLATCVTGTAQVSLKTWPAEKWAALLSDWAARRGRRFLMLGLPGERPVAEEVRRLMGDRADHAAVWMEEGSSIELLVALTSLSSGYAGHDTGPMHVAAALGKPVLGVFGGGTWPRFTPRVTPSVAVMVGVACAGCDWSCSFDTSHCIKDVPLEAVMRAADDLEEGRIKGREARVLEPSPALRDRMILEVSRFAQDQVREAGKWLKELEYAKSNGLADALRERDEISREASGMAEQLVASAAEAGKLRAETAGVMRQLREREQAVVELRAEAAWAEAEAKQLRQEHAALRARAEETEPLREQIRRLEERVRSMEAAGAGLQAPRRPWRQVLTELFTGNRDYVPWTLRTPQPLPKITLATFVGSDTGTGADAEAEAARQTIESVVSQVYPQLDYVVIDGSPEGATSDVIESLRKRIEARGRIIREPDAASGLRRAFDTSEADVIGWLDAGDVHEPGALLRVAEAFRDNPRSPAIYFDDTREVAGWRFPPTPRPKLEVYRLLTTADTDEPVPATVFFRRHEYALLGKLSVPRGRAATWDLVIRFSRRYGLDRGKGHVTCRSRNALVGANAAADGAAREELCTARKEFLGSFGMAGRVRCTLIHWFEEVPYFLRGLTRRRRLEFPLPAESAGNLPPREAPPFVPGQPASPLLKRLPDRLLFTTPDTNTPDRRLHRVYYDAAGDAALAYPPEDLEHLAGLYASRSRESQPAIVPPEEGVASPYAGYRGGRAWERLLARVPGPYWWFRKLDFADRTGPRLIEMVGDLIPPGEDRFRLLNVGCFEGAVLDYVKAHTKWQTAGTETNAAAAEVARGKGHAVWVTSAQEAFMELPEGESFDLIFLSGVVEHLQDPVMVLRRLRLLLRPGGLLVLNQPNLDSKLLDLFGPTWSYWQLPYHRTLLGRRGVSNLARMVDLRVARVRTYTDPYPATVSAQLNRLGLGAIVPDSAQFSNDISSRGVRLTGWARMLWDPRGKGDYLWAVLHAP